MLRRPPLRLTFAATTVAFALSGCATFSNTGDVADVDGTPITNDEFEAVSRSYFETDLFFDPGSTVDDRIVDGRVGADVSRNLLTAAVRQQLLREFLDEQGVDNSQIRTEFQTVALPQTPLAAVDVDPALLDLFTDSDGTVVSRSLGLVSVPNIDELERRYSTDPSSTGLLCVRHIVVETEVEANEIIRELVAGADFAELAAERSIDDASAANGGAIVAPDNECIPLATARQGFEPAFAAGLIGGGEGALVGPVETTFGWHVILTRPWDEISDSAVALYQPEAAGALLFDGFKATTDIEVDPRFGSWNVIDETVEPIG